MNPSRPFPVDKRQYPFTDQWFVHSKTALHYLDVGAGTPVLMLHGNPSWSFMYRKVILGLRGRCRCIAPDYPGFGYSGHPPGYGYRPAEHAWWVNALIDALGLERYILVVQDWGGPIGLSVAVRSPERVAGIVLCNSWCWPPLLNARLFSWIMGGLLGRYLHLRHNFFARVMVPLGIFHQKSRSPAILSAYTGPFPDPGSRMGTYVFPREIRKSSPWLKQTERQLVRLKDKPVRMVWAKRDPAFGWERYIRKWRSYFPDASVERLWDASHYLPEDRPDRVVAAVAALLD